MKITFLNPVANMSGGQRVVAIYADLLTKRGHEVTLVSLPPKKISYKNQLKSFLKSGHITIQTSKTPSHFDSLKNIKHIILDSHRPVVNNDLPDADVVIATWWETAEWVANLDVSKGRKFYFVQGYEVFPYLPIERVKTTYKLPFKKITISQWLVDKMRDEYQDETVALVPNAVDHNQFYSDKRIKQKTPTYSMIYTNQKVKGCDVSIDAFVRARDEQPDLKLIAFGTCDITEKLPLPKGAVYVKNPNQDKIREIYSSTDAYLFSSRSEGFGLPVLESMACRTPVIATRAGCAPDFVRDGINGALNDVDDVEAQKNSILEIALLNENDWCAYSEHAYNSVKSLSWEKSCDLFEKEILD